MLRPLPSIRASGLLVCLAAGLFAAPARIWLDVPFVRQQKQGCGAAAIAMLLRYWQGQGFSPRGETADPASIQQALFSEEARGIWGSDIERYLQSQGFKTFVFSGRWQDLRRHLQSGRPLMVCLDAAGPGGDRHYAVISGIDEQEGLVLLNDPARRKLTKVHREQFEREWTSTRNWTLLAVPAPTR